MAVSTSMSVEASAAALGPQELCEESTAERAAAPLEQPDATEMSRLRHEIDALNVQMLRLLEARGNVALQIMNIKRRNRLPTHDPAREELMLRRIIAQSNGVYRSEGIRDFYRCLFRLSVDTMNEWRQPSPVILTGTAR